MPITVNQLAAEPDARCPSSPVDAERRRPRRRRARPSGSAPLAALRNAPCAARACSVASSVRFGGDDARCRRSRPRRDVVAAADGALTARHRRRRPRTGPIRRIIAGASVRQLGVLAEERLARPRPRAGSCRAGRARPAGRPCDSTPRSPSTATIAAMPIAMPRAASAARAAAGCAGRSRRRRHVAPRQAQVGRSRCRHHRPACSITTVAQRDAARERRPRSHASCVMITIVEPARVQLAQQREDARRRCAESRLPVGSSASTIAGSPDERPRDRRPAGARRPRACAGRVVAPVRRARRRSSAAPRPARRSRRADAARTAARSRRSRRAVSPSSRLNCWNTKPMSRGAQRRERCGRRQRGDVVPVDAAPRPTSAGRARPRRAATSTSPTRTARRSRPSPRGRRSC